MSTTPVPGAALELVEAPYDGPAAQELDAEVQQEYVVRYGGPDATPMDPAQFAPPAGAFLLAVAGGQVVGGIGMRAHADGAVEVKRLYVRPAHRRRGHASALLAALERRARAGGARRVVLETGSRQPEAVALYERAGYTRTEAFGHYAGSETSIHLAKDL